MSDTKYEFYRYTPSLAAAIIFISLFFKISLIHTYQLVRTRTYSFIPFCIGGFMESVGYIGRAVGSDKVPIGHSDPSSYKLFLFLSRLP